VWYGTVSDLSVGKRKIMETIKLEHAERTYKEAIGFFKTLERTLENKSKFSNELLYQMSAMCFEKLFVALLAFHGKNATHHMPYALICEVETIIPIPSKVRDSAKFIGLFESICSLSSFGYKMPNNEELRKIIVGLVDCNEFVANNLNP
jgi:hypothetical protein